MLKLQKIFHGILSWTIYLGKLLIFVCGILSRKNIKGTEVILENIRMFIKKHTQDQENGGTE